MAIPTKDVSEKLEVIRKTQEMVKSRQITKGLAAEIVAKIENDIKAIIQGQGDD